MAVSCPGMTKWDLVDLVGKYAPSALAPVLQAASFEMYFLDLKTNDNGVLPESTAAFFQSYEQVEGLCSLRQSDCKSGCVSFLN